jgi:hypothetical protein
MIPHDISQQITVRSFWLMVSNSNMSREQARQLAAEQLAEEWREKAKHERRAARPLPQAHDDPHRRLLGMVEAMIDRLYSYSRPRRELRNTGEPARPSLARRIVDAFTPEPTQPKPSAPRSPLVVAEGSNAKLIDDLPHRYGGDYATENWRASIETNARQFEERRGGPKRSWYVG